MLFLLGAAKPPRVQKVQRGQRVQRGRWRPSGAEYKIKKGAWLRHRLWPAVAGRLSKKVVFVYAQGGAGSRLFVMRQCRHQSKSRNAGSFLRKELPDRAEDRSEIVRTEMTLLSSVGYDDTASFES